MRSERPTADRPQAEEDDEWERRLASALRREAARDMPGPDCPAPDALVRLAGQGPDDLNRDPVYASHIVLCGWCRGELEAMRAGLAAVPAGTPRAARAPAARARAPLRFWAIPAVAAVLLAALLLPLRRSDEARLRKLREENDQLRTALKEARQPAAVPSPVPRPSATPSLAAVSPSPRPRPIPAPVVPRPDHPVIARAERPRPAPSVRATPAARAATPRPPVVVALADRTDRVPDLSALRPRHGVVRGPASSPPAWWPIAPVGTRVLSDRPRFTWRACPDATGYAVVIAYPNDTEIVRTDGRVTATEWTPSVALPRGKTLVWEVTAYGPDGEIGTASEARFAVVTLPEAAAVAHAEAEFGRAALDLCAAFARAGLFDDAGSALESLLAGPSLAAPDRARAEWLLRAVREKRPSGGEANATGERSEAPAPAPTGP